MEKKTHKDLDVWKKSLDLAEMIYNITKEFPQEEKFLLVDQLRRTAVSIPSNIAEGASRNSKKEFMQFLFISLGSLSELETQLLLSLRFGYLSDSKGSILNEADQIRRMIIGLIKSIRARG